jgi:hypothetical protein
MEQNIFSLKKENGNIFSLWKNDSPTSCMKANMVPVPSPIDPNQVTLVPRPCNSACPFFTHAEKINKDDPGIKVNGILLKCMDKPLFVEITEKKEKEIKQDLTIKR